MKFVLDCSITMAWCFEDKSEAYSESILSALKNGYLARVPPIWKLEVCNVLLITERKKRIDSFIANNFKNALSVLPISVDNSANDRVFDTVFELARELRLTVYDTAYLELAIREKIPIASLDRALIEAARKVHVEQLIIRDSHL